MEAAQKLKINNSITMLLKHAAGDSGGSKRCAMFLLSLWSGEEFKADLQELLYNDAEIFSSMIFVLQYLYDTNSQLDSFVSGEKIKPVIDVWGPVFRENPKEKDFHGPA